MLALQNVVDLVKDDFYQKNIKDKCHDFFYSSALTHAISLEIASSTYADKCLSYEMLCKRIPPKLGCRSTIYSTLNNAVSKGFFCKTIFKERQKSKVLLFIRRVLSHANPMVLTLKRNIFLN